MKHKLTFESAEKVMRDLKYTEKPCPFCQKTEWAVKLSEGGNPKLMCMNCGIELEFSQIIIEEQLRFV